MKIAIWSVTRGAGKVALKIKKQITNCDAYTLSKFELEDTIQIESFNDTLISKFNSYDAHIFIMATGIVVRKIASLIKSKDVDPAIIVIDEKERFIISLLSGHLGGANELTSILANKLNLLPVITTSSDITGKIAVDTLSQKMNCEMENLEKAKKITSLIVDNKKVEVMLPNNVTVNSNNKNTSGVVIVSNKENIEVMRLYPKNIILGIGCKRNTSMTDILKAIYLVMNKHNLCYKSIKSIATVDVKADEKGLIDASKFLKKELVIIDRNEIKKVETMFKGSEFVKKQIGVTCVSEPCAYLASSKQGEFLEMKFIYNGITISIYEEKFGDE